MAVGFRVIRQPLQHWASHSAGSRRESELVGGADHLYFSSRRDVLVLLTKGVSLRVIAQCRAADPGAVRHFEVWGSLLTKFAGRGCNILPWP